MAWRPLVCAMLLLATSVLAFPAPAGATACPLPAPTKLVQNDAGSGRDAGDTPDQAISVGADGYQWGTVDTLVATETGLGDVHDWYYADIPPGPHDVTVRILAQINHVAFDDVNKVALLYWLEVFRAGESSAVYDAAVWYPPYTFHADGERLLLHVFWVPILISPTCAAADPGPSVAPLPSEAQLYGALFQCDPVCKA